MTSSHQRLDGLSKDNVVHGYRIERILGSGAFGISYLSEHTLFHTWHVIKEYMPDNALRDGTMHVQPKSEADDSFFAWGMTSFLEEARLLHGMSHPHVVKVTDLFQANGTAYFVMPFLQGCTLHQWIESNLTPDQKELETLFVPLLEGLKYIHSRNLLHRDIKPENIFITEKGHPVLIDFGAARFVIGAKSKALTQVLTPHFAPIEQYASKGTFTPALDIYSLAGCMYYAITHEFPVEAPDRIQHDAQSRLLGSAWQNRYSPSFLSAVDKALSLGARDRFQDAFDFQKALLAEGGDLVFLSPDEPRSQQEDPVIKAYIALRQRVQTVDKKTLKKTVSSINLYLVVLIMGIISLWYSYWFLFFWLLFFLIVTAGRYGNENLKEERAIKSPDMEFVLIPAGTFMLGSPESEKDRCDEEALHQVTISKPFYIGKYAVTQAQWEAVMDSNPSKFKEKNHPVERVSWHDVQEFIQKLNAKDQAAQYRLPTEAEWEYAARAGSVTAYCFGDEVNPLKNYAWYWDNSGEQTHPVGQKISNDLGLHDMYGNVWEWVQDWYGKEYCLNSSGTDPKGPSAGKYRVARGGSWCNAAMNCRSASRTCYSPDDQAGNVGFRLAFSPNQQYEKGHMLPTAIRKGFSRDDIFPPTP